MQKENKELSFLINSDCWSSYNRIRHLDKDFSHQTVNHDLYFVDPKTGVHTNGIVSNWCAAKSHIKKMRGVSRNYLQTYLDEFCWRRKNCKNKYDAAEVMLDTIAKHYPIGHDCVDDLIGDVEKVEINENLFDVMEEEETDFEIPPLPDYSDDAENEQQIPNNIAADLVEKNTDDINESVDIAVASIATNTTIPDDVEVAEPEDQFKKYVLDTVKDVLDNKKSFKFSSQLTVDQRRIVHGLADTNNLFHITTGTRYKCITILYYDTTLSPKRTSQKVAQSLKSLNVSTLPISENVCDVLNDKKLSSKYNLRSKKK